MFKRIIGISLIICCLSFSLVLAENIQTEHLDKAKALKEMGLFLGSDEGFELERAPSRLECSVMLVRILGKEEEAKEKHYEHPFTDVPEWGNDYIGYLYQNNLTYGIGDNKFGSSNFMDAKSYVTFVLRALGYSDKEGDFTYEESIDKAIEIKLIQQEDANYDFLRDDVVLLSYNALNMKLKSGELKLIDKLINEGVVDEDKAKELGLRETNNDGSLDQDEVFSPLSGTHEIINIGNIELSDGNIVYAFDDISFRYGKNGDGEERIYVTIDRSELPDVLKDFVYCDMMGSTYEDEVTKSVVKQDIMDTVNKWNHYFNYDKLGKVSNGRCDTDFMQLVRIYDENKEVIGYCAIRLL